MTLFASRGKQQQARRQPPLRVADPKHVKTHVGFWMMMAPTMKMMNMRVWTRATVMRQGAQPVRATQMRAARLTAMKATATPVRAT